MSSGLNFVLLLGVVVTVIGHSSALTCMSCVSNSNSNCNDPFKFEGISTCNGPSCTKIWVKKNGISVLQRDCGLNVSTSDVLNVSDDCINFENEDIIMCWCSKDFCNAGYLLKPANLILFALIAVFTICMGY